MKYLLAGALLTGFVSALWFGMHFDMGLDPLDYSDEMLHRMGI